MTTVEAATTVDLRPRAVQDAPRVSTLEMLRDELRVSLDKGTVTYRVDARPRFSVEYRLDLDLPQMEGWRRASIDPATGDQDFHLFNRTVLAAQCSRIWHDGQVVNDSAGRPVTFASDDFQRLLNVPAGSPDGAVEAVRAFYGGDIPIVAVVDALSAKAGIGKQAEEVDPTRPLSSTSPTSR